MFIDTHTHLSYKEGIEPHLFVANAKKSGVEILIVSCCSMESIEEGLKLIKEFDNIYLTIGIHPEYVGSYNDTDLESIYNLAKNCDRIIGIGEIGLDYHYESKNKDAQKILFRKQLDIAKKLNLPVVIHSRDAIRDTYDMLSSSGLKGIIHCYSGSLEMAKRYINLGFYLGIGGVLTFKNSKLYQVIEEIGLDKIVLETDSPYLSPEPYRGSVNESKNIPIIAKKLGDILGVDIMEVEDITTNNVFKIFRNI